MNINPSDGLMYAVDQTPVSRRQFLKSAGFGMMCLALSSCSLEKGTPSNTAFVAGLQGKIGFEITNITPEEEIWQFLSDRTYGPQFTRWMTNTSLGKISTSKGEIEIITDNTGEPSYGVKVGFDYPAPLPEQLKNNRHIEKISFDNGIKVYIYGTLGTHGRIKAGRGIFNDFLQDYFRSAKGQQKNLHLNFMPASPVLFIPEGYPQNLGQGRRPLEGTTFSSSYGDARNIERFDVVVNFNLMHSHIESLGLPPQARLRGIFANERAGVITISRSNSPTVLLANDAPSTIIDLLASFDNVIARKVLGTHYGPVFKLLEEEMNILQKIGMKKPVAQIDRRQAMKYLVGQVVGGGAMFP